MQPLSLSQQLAIGMAVFDAAGDKLGTLVRADPPFLIVEHGFFFQTAFEVPMQAVARVDGDGIWLSPTKDELAPERWNGLAPADILAAGADAPI